jgi:hypothetical protein
MMLEVVGSFQESLAFQGSLEQLDKCLRFKIVKKESNKLMSSLRLLSQGTYK